MTHSIKTAGRMLSAMLAFLAFSVSAKADEPASASALSVSGTLPVMYIDTENGSPVVSKEVYLNASYWLDPMGAAGIFLHNPPAFHHTHMRVLPEPENPLSKPLQDVLM